MADDHIHLAVSADGTLYAAVKTGYDKSGYAKIALLVRRPNGSWDNLYYVDDRGTRATIAVDDVAGKLVIAYESTEGGGEISLSRVAAGHDQFVAGEDDDQWQPGECYDNQSYDDRQDRIHGR